jgi:hypothetical protein
MRRLLKISFDLALLSFIPILSWFCLSLVIDKKLINIFTLTYPIQFILYILKSIFSTGANINKEKDKNEDAVMSGIVLGSIFAFFIYGIIILNIEKYINFMNMDVSIYKNFAIYSVLQLFIQLIFMFIIEKLYYEEKNTLANKYSIIFNLLNFIVLIFTSLVTKNQIIIISITLISILLFTMYIFIKNFDKFKLNIQLVKWIKYDSVELFNNITFFFIFLFGLSNAMEFGEQYTLALTFVALITDTQWDTFGAITEAANIDISKSKFNYKEHIKNAYKLLFILLITVFLMFIVLFKFYDLNIKLVAIYFNFELLNFLMYPVYRINTCYLQLEYSPIKITTNKIVASGLRLAISLFPTPFCTGIGQVVSSIYQFVSTNIILKKNYDISNEIILE